jgi:GGDEF domain-containing protein
MSTKSAKHFSLLDQSKSLSKNKFFDAAFTNEFGRIETARSERYGLSYSVIIVHVDNFKKGEFTPDKQELLAFLKKLVATVLDVVRNCDVVGMLEDRRIIIVLPQTDYFGSLITTRKLTKALEFVTTKGEPYASLIYSQATFPRDAGGHDELVATSLRRVTEKKESLWERLELKDKLFWEIMETVHNLRQNSPTYSNFDAAAPSENEPFIVDTINDMALQEVVRSPRRRGILYLGVKNVMGDLPVLKTLNAMGRTATNVFILGGGEKEETIETKSATTLSLTDLRLKQTYFTFFFNEDIAYALICKEAWGDAYTCFHTVDPYLVEGLIMKFQRDYSLQEQL